MTHTVASEQDHLIAKLTLKEALLRISQENELKMNIENF